MNHLRRSWSTKSHITCVSKHDPPISADVHLEAPLGGQEIFKLAEIRRDLTAEQLSWKSDGTAEHIRWRLFACLLASSYFYVFSSHGMFWSIAWYGQGGEGVREGEGEGLHSCRDTGFASRLLSWGHIMSANLSVSGFGFLNCGGAVLWRAKSGPTCGARTGVPNSSIVHISPNKLYIILYIYLDRYHIWKSYERAAPGYYIEHHLYPMQVSPKRNRNNTQATRNKSDKLSKTQL